MPGGGGGGDGRVGCGPGAGRSWFQPSGPCNPGSGPGHPRSCRSASSRFVTTCLLRVVRRGRCAVHFDSASARLAGRPTEQTVCRRLQGPDGDCHRRHPTVPDGSAARRLPAVGPSPWLRRRTASLFAEARPAQLQGVFVIAARHCVPVIGAGARDRNCAREGVNPLVRSPWEGVCTDGSVRRCRGDRQSCRRCR